MALKKGTVYLVGAGPGDHGLITLRGLDCIRDADTIVYDRLVNPVLLGYARSDVELIYVGKSPDHHTMRQDEINDVLVREAKKDKSVVRLKGGDPFVFGRGGEEAEYLLENNVAFEVVPGISSAIAAPAYAGVPVTHRGVASSFAVITGHEADDKSSDRSINWEKIATGCDTLIFLMGMESLSSIVNNLLRHGRDPLEPVALIQSGTTPDQRSLIGNLSNIIEEATKANFAPPTIILVGKVASLGKKLSWFGKKPLSGKRVMITRPRHQAQKMVELVKELGGEPWTFPTIEINAIRSPLTPLIKGGEIDFPLIKGSKDDSPIIKRGKHDSPLNKDEKHDPPLNKGGEGGSMDHAIACIDRYSWLLFTSVNGVSAFFDRMQYLRKDIRSLKDIKICAIGPKTKEEVEKRGLMVDYVPKDYTSHALANDLKDILKKDDRVLIPRAKSAPDTFGNLREMGFHIDEVPAYETVQAKGNIQIVKDLFWKRKIHILTFTSASTVTNFVDMMAVENIQELLDGVIIACIGPVTAKAANNLGIPVQVVAKEYTIEGLLASILDYIYE